MVFSFYKFKVYIPYSFLKKYNEIGKGTIKLNKSFLSVYWTLWLIQEALAWKSRAINTLIDGTAAPSFGRFDCFGGEFTALRRKT